MLSLQTKTENDQLHFSWKKWLISFLSIISVVAECWWAYENLSNDSGHGVLGVNKVKVCV